MVVNVDCRLCPRKGCYRLARLAAKLGPEAALDDVLSALAVDCHLYRRDAKPRAYEARCGIRLTDLWMAFQPPPDDPSDAPALRMICGIV